MATVIPRYVVNTLLLMAGVGVLAVLFGVSTAWVSTRYAFPESGYLNGFCFFRRRYPPISSPTPTPIFWNMPVRFSRCFGTCSAGAGRPITGFPKSGRLAGPIIVMASVLYPYIYMVTRIAFRLTPSSLFEIALVHDKSQFWSVGLPLARPAITAGLALVLMEVVSDFGTVEYFAVETLTLGIFNVWLGMNNIVAAAQISLFGFVFILSLLGLELYARSRQRFSGSARPVVELQPLPLNAKKTNCLPACLRIADLPWLRDPGWRSAEACSGGSVCRPVRAGFRNRRCVGSDGMRGGRNDRTCLDTCGACRDLSRRCGAAAAVDGSVQRLCHSGNHACHRRVDLCRHHRPHLRRSCWQSTGNPASWRRRYPPDRLSGALSSSRIRRHDVRHPAASGQYDECQPGAWETGLVQVCGGWCCRCSEARCWLAACLCSST